MMDFTTEAVVLDLVDWREQDSLAYFYTPDYGKVTARVRGTKKIVSKLAGHLQPMDWVSVRVIDKNGAQLADALTIQRGRRDPAGITVAQLVKELGAEWQADDAIWRLLKSMLIIGDAPINSKKILGVLGFDSRFAACHYCQGPAIVAFSLEDLNFYCQRCINRINKKIYV